MHSGAGGRYDLDRQWAARQRLSPFELKYMFFQLYQHFSFSLNYGSQQMFGKIKMSAISIGESSPGERQHEKQTSKGQTAG
jgi:hypothetical protein